MRISDWSSDVCSSDLHGRIGAQYAGAQADGVNKGQFRKSVKLRLREAAFGSDQERGGASPEGVGEVGDRPCRPRFRADQKGPPVVPAVQEIRHRERLQHLRTVDGTSTRLNSSP